MKRSLLKSAAGVEAGSRRPFRVTLSQRRSKAARLSLTLNFLNFAPAANPHGQCEHW